MSASQFHRAWVQCPRCLNDIHAVIWDVVDAAADPDLKDRLLQKKIQQQECLNCGHAFILAEPLLYREDQHQLLVLYTPGAEAAADGEPASGSGAGAGSMPEAGASSNATAAAAPEASAASPDAVAAAPVLSVPDPGTLPGWRLRRVGDYNSLIETIHIHDHYCDDRLMAVVKIAIQTQGCLDPEPVAIHFLTADATAMRFVARTQEGEWFSVDFPPDIYTNTEEVFKDALGPEQGWLTVDAAYGAALVRRQTARLDAERNQSTES